MVVKPGYQQTEVGVIPDDWGVDHLGNISSISSGTTPFRELRERYYSNGTINWVKTLDLNNREIVETDERVTEIALKETSLKIYDVDTVLVAMYGGFNQIGRTGILKIPAAVNQAISAIRVDNKKLNPTFLINFFNYQVGYWKNVAISSRKDPNITSADVKNFPVVLPPLVEQQAIAEALSDVDGLISALDALIAKKRAIKQGAMQELLTGQRRLPGFAGEWEKVYLGDLFTFKNGLNKGKEFFGFGTPIVNYMDVFENAGIFCSKLEGRVSLTTQEIKNFDVRKGDVLFTRTSETPDEVGMAAVILDDPDQTVFSGFVLRGRPKTDRLCDSFKAYCFRSSFVRNQIIAKASYTTRALTNGRILSAVVLSLPPSKAEQTAIAQLLADMDGELAALAAKRAKTVALKAGMMQTLLTGQVRLV
jgi:type I restriction enzyme S subunit